MTHEFCSIFIRTTVKQGRSLTRTVSPDEIHHVRSKSEVSAERLLKRRKHFLQSVMVFVTVLKLVLVQPGAKINSVYYCENVLEQGLLLTIRRISKTISCSSRMERRHTVHTTLSLRPTYVPMCLSSMNQKNWPPNSRNLNTADYSVCWALQQMVYRHQIWDTGLLPHVLIDSLTQVSQDTLNPAIDQLYQKDWRWLSCWTLSELTIGVRYRPCFTDFVWKLSKAHASLQFWGIDDLRKLSKEYYC